MTFVATLEPAALWGHFDAILTIPRGSTNEEAMRRHVAGIATSAGLVHEVDSAGNIVVRKPGTAGHENVPVTILQGHLDMVTEKNADVEHDFTTDPIIPRMDGDYVKASGTTLGSDNGIGVATMLAVMEATDVVHGPLECLFTIDEETGLTGAAQLDSDLLKGRQLINLDSEEEGVLYVGCAGGGDTRLTVDLGTTPTDACSAAMPSACWLVPSGVRTCARPSGWNASRAGAHTTPFLGRRSPRSAWAPRSAMTSSPRSTARSSRYGPSTVQPIRRCTWPSVTGTRQPRRGMW
jgi:hypothetical protein